MKSQHTNMFTLPQAEWAPEPDPSQPSGTNLDRPPNS